MKQYVTQSPLEEVSEALRITDTLDITTDILDTTEEPQTSRLLPSYHPTPWKLVNRVLDIVDTVTGGRADWVQRLFTYLFIGGVAALVNLAVFSLVLYGIHMPTNLAVLHNLLAFVLASEISIMANFVPNDFVTFRHLPGRERTWAAHCTRFHITSIGGVILTYVLQFGLIFLAHVHATLSQAIALILVLVYNFSAHHLFTYRHVKPKAA